MASKKDAPLPKLEAPATQQDLQDWYTKQEQLTKLKEEEMKLRKKLFASFFPTPMEGVNTVPLNDGWVLKGTYKIDRKIIEELYVAHAAEFKEARLPVKELVVMKPSLSISWYNSMSDEDKLLFDKALEIKPGAPTLEVVKPKRQ